VVPGVKAPDKGGVAKVVNISSKELLCYFNFFITVSQFSLSVIFRLESYS